MISRTLATLALRNRLIGTTICTTGSMALSATANGYARASGSFLIDHFAVGMEITSVAGFSVAGNNQATSAQGRIITYVDATTISCAGCAVDAAASGRTITVGLPFKKAFENVGGFAPAAGFPYLEEEFVPATNRARTVPASSAYIEDTGLYIVRLFGLSGSDILAIGRYVDAVLARFTPGTELLLSDGTTLRVPVDLGPKAGQITPIDGGWSYVSIDVPYIGESINAIAA